MTLAFDLALERGSFSLALALDVPRGVTVLYGPSGAGKSLTLGALAGLVPARGKIVLADRTLLDGRVSLPPHRRRIGLVPQEGRLFPHLSVARNLRYGAPSPAVRPSFDDVVSALDLAPLLERAPRDLSGGERQRVALGRALLAAPDALLLDEPLASLDRERRARIVPYLRRMKAAFAGPVVYVTHALDEALALGDRACVIDNGRKVAEGAPLEVFGAPRSELVPRLTGFENVLEVTIVSHGSEDDVTTVSAKGATLVVPRLDGAPGGRAFLGLAASDVLLATEEPHGLSARNVLAASIIDVVAAGRCRLVRLDVGGLAITARVVASAAAALGLEPGKRVHVVIKSTSFTRLG